MDTIRKWRSRVAASGPGGLRDLARSGRPPVFEATAVAEVKALACQLPAETGVPLSRWSHHATTIPFAPSTGIGRAALHNLLQRVSRHETVA